MTEELRERVARAICTAIEQNGGPPWGFYDRHALAQLFDEADAAIATCKEHLPVGGWLPLPPVPVPGVAPWDGEFVETARAGGKIPMVAEWDDEDGWTTFNRCYETVVQPHTGKPWRPTHWRPIVMPSLPSAPAVEG